MCPRELPVTTKLKEK